MARLFSAGAGGQPGLLVDAPGLERGVHWPPTPLVRRPPLPPASAALPPPPCRASRSPATAQAWSLHARHPAPCRAHGTVGHGLAVALRTGPGPAERGLLRPKCSAGADPACVGFLFSLSPCGLSACKGHGAPRVPAPPALRSAGSCCGCAPAGDWHRAWGAPSAHTPSERGAPPLSRVGLGPRSVLGQRRSGGAPPGACVLWGPCRTEPALRLCAHRSGQRGRFAASARRALRLWFSVRRKVSCSFCPVSLVLSPVGCLIGAPSSLLLTRTWVGRRWHTHSHRPVTVQL